jgi:hypothetical protein
MWPTGIVAERVGGHHQRSETRSASSAESVGSFRFGQSTKRVIEGDFDAVVSAKSVRKYESLHRLLRLRWFPLPFCHIPDPTRIGSGLLAEPRRLVEFRSGLAGDFALAAYYFFLSVREDLLIKMGMFAEARQEIQRAIEQ